jgi:hypothetical protein
MGPIVKRLATAVTTTVGTTDTYDFTMNGRQRARIYYRCSANPTGTPSVALALVALIPDFSTAADVPTTPMSFLPTARLAQEPLPPTTS